MAELSVPSIDFSSIGQLPDIYKKAQDDAQVKQTLASLGQGGAVDAQTLLKSGNLSLAQLGAAFQNHQDTLHQQEVANARQAAQDAFNNKIALRTANRADEDKFSIQKVDNPDGTTSLVRVKRTGAEGVIPTGITPSVGGKPVPIETMNGTQFLIRQPGGGFGRLDPTTVPLIGSGVTGTQPAEPNTIPAPASPTTQPAPVALPSAAPAGPAASSSASPTPQQQEDPGALDPQTGRRESYLKSLDPQVQGYIKKIADYEIDPRTTSLKGGMREKVLSAVAQYDPTYNQNEFGTRAKAMKDFGTGPQGNSVRSFDVAIDHLDLLKKYTKALDSGDIRLVNSLRNAWLQETGSPLPTNLQAVAPIVGAEVSKAVIGSNNALADREELRAPLRSANSVPQINGAIEAYQGLMAGQLKGLKKQYEDTTGKKNFDSRVRESTRNILLGKKEDADPSSAPNVTSSGVKWSIQ